MVLHPGKLLGLLGRGKKGEREREKGREERSYLCLVSKIPTYKRPRCHHAFLAKKQFYPFILFPTLRLLNEV